MWREFPTIVLKDGAASAVAHGAGLAKGGILALPQPFPKGARVALVTRTNTLIATGVAQHDSKEVGSVRHGWVVDETRVFVDADRYPGPVASAPSGVGGRAGPVGLSSPSLRPSVRSRGPEHPTAGSRLFGGLARGIVRHPWYPVIFWVALLVVVLPFLPLLGSVTTNSTEALPSNAPSAVANAELARLFPQASGGSSSILLFVGTNLTDPNGQGVIENVTTTLVHDPSLPELSGVSSVYTSYAGYLAGQLEVAGGAIGAALRSSTPLPSAVNKTAGLLWGPPATFLATWSSLAGNSTMNASGSNYPALRATEATLANDSSGLAVLSAFYSGYGGSSAGFNGTPACAADPRTVLPCADDVARAQEAPLVPSLVPVPAQRVVPDAVLGGLGVTNFTLWPAGTEGPPRPSWASRWGSRAGGSRPSGRLSHRAR